MTIRHLRGGVALIGTASELATANPVLLARQLSLETDTGVQKIGDGTTHYASLTAVPSSGGGGGGGGGGRVVSWLGVNIAAAVVALPERTGIPSRLDVPWVAGDGEGSDLALADDGLAINVLTDGLYAIQLDLWYVRSADADGIAVMWVNAASTSAYLSWSSGTLDTTMSPTAGNEDQRTTETVFSIPPVALNAGDSVGVRTRVDLAAGSVGLSSFSQFSIVRVS